MCKTAILRAIGLIIGGGIGGLCAAIALRRVGIDSRVFEQADSLREVGAGLTIWRRRTLPWPLAPRESG